MTLCCGPRTWRRRSSKFHFGEDEGDWAGIRLTNDKAQSLPEHVRAFREFPRPNNITDLRSYFALVNQVAHYYAVSPHLEPFRELMKKKSTWYWDNALERLFEESREQIAKSVMEGITRYDKLRWTAVITDF